MCGLGQEKYDINAMSDLTEKFKSYLNLKDLSSNTGQQAVD